MLQRIASYMMPSDSSKMTFDVEDVLTKLTTDEKIALLSGIDFWHTAPVHRLNVKSIRLTDGPNGVRGTRFFNGIPAACFPCGTALAATWDTELIRDGGAVQASEAIAKGASVILGPTTNMQRSPLGGRGFESFSEDPFLAGAMSAATVQGIQSKGVAATIKHFVCNDQEHERMGVDSIVSERALREIYLRPFQIAQRDAKPWCYMTSYNRVNGLHASENPKLVKEILRAEWGFDGMVMSDWFGTYSTTEAIKAGLDLEMPGPSYIRGKLINQALTCRKLVDKDLDDCVREVLKLVKKVAPLGIPENAPETTMDTKETAQLLRTVAANSIVLMKNDKNVLPLKKDKTVAVIGPNAKIAAYCGGGSASLLPYYTITPFDGITAQAKDVKYALGATAYKKLPFLSYLTKTKSGESGMTMKVYLDPPSKKDREQVDEVHVRTADVMLMDYKHPRLPSDHLYYMVLEGQFTPDETDMYQFSVSVAGTAKLFVDGKMIVDNETKQVMGDSFFGSGTREEIGELKLQKGKTYNISVTAGSLPTMTVKSPGATAMGAGGIRVGGTRKTDAKVELERAVKLAKEVDQVIICAGLNSDFESEGYDREHMDLPAGTDSLISAVTAANPNTVVVIQSGTPVTMAPWLASTPALLQAWYGGNETGNAIADVLFGDVNPSAKLPLSFPVRNQDNPAFLNYRSERGRTLYGEDVYVGYRYYEKTQTAVSFPFGHGLGYAEFAISGLHISSSSDTKGASDDEDDTLVVVEVDVTNKGKVDGAQVVQVYVAQKNPSIGRPVKELRGFAKVLLKPGEKKKVEVRMSKKYAASFWDETREAWVMEKDRYEVLVGDSSANTPLKGEFVVDKTSWWNGL